eukprot:1455118-Pleurochrysis_carterae.AAC.1
MRWNFKTRKPVEIDSDFEDDVPLAVRSAESAVAAAWRREAEAKASVQEATRIKELVSRAHAKASNA